MTRRLAYHVARLQRCSGFLNDLEIFLISKVLRCRHVELPVVFVIQSEKSTVRIISEVFRGGYWLCRIAMNYWCGRYRATVLNHYRGVGPTTRWFLRARWLWTPYAKVAALLPKTGAVLDFGCGHGLLALTAALQSSAREITALDHDSTRIQTANAAGKNITNLHYHCGGFSQIDWKIPFAAIVFFDVLHYFSLEEQESYLKKAWGHLPPGGVLLVREVDQTGGLLFWINRWHEKTMLRLGFTQARNLHFRDKTDWCRLLERIGFSVTVQRYGHFPFADILFVARKNLKPTKREAREKTSRSSLVEQHWITADDWGLSPGVNEGISRLVKAGVVRKIAAMANVPYVEIGLGELLLNRQGIWGIHFNLTYGAPLSPRSTPLLTKNGTFLSLSQLAMTWLTANRRRRKLLEAAIRAELNAQLAHLEKLGIPLRFFNTHHHIHILPGFMAAIIAVLQTKGIHEVRIPNDPRLWWSRKFALPFLSHFTRKTVVRSGMNFLPFVYPNKKHFLHPDRFLLLLEKRPPTEVMVHPAITNDFRLRNVVDAYALPRVTEYHGLLALGLVKK